MDDATDVQAAPEPQPQPQTSWQAHLEDGTDISESESTWDALKASGKAEKIAALTLHTPAGDVTLTTGLPGILFPFKHELGTGIARIENSAGQCVCALWSEAEQKLVPEIYLRKDDLLNAG